MLKGPNIVFIVLDTARAHNFSCYGYGKRTTPNIDRIANEGILFENAISSSPWTLPSHASIFTGLCPSDHGCHERHKFLDTGIYTLPQYLKENGYKTIAISNNSWISKSFGFDKGFDEFINLWQLVQCDTDLAAPSAKGADKYMNAAKLFLRGDPITNIINGIYGKFFWRRYDYGARRINRLLKSYMGGGLKGSQPFFLFVNYLESHLIYKAPEPYFGKFLPADASLQEAGTVNQDAWAYMGGLVPMGSRDREVLTALYDGELAYLDHRIGEVYEFLKQNGLLDNTMLILTSDHGENLVEHNLMDHQYCLYDTLLKVPLIIRYPEAFERAKRSDRIVQTLDLFPTIQEILKTDEWKQETQGVSLLHEESDRFAVSEYLGPQPTMEAIFRRYPNGDFKKYDRSLFSIRTKDWKLIMASDGRDELYAVSQDPHEIHNLLESEPDVYRELKEKARKWKEVREGEGALREEAHMSDEIKKRLESLGYFN